MECGQAPGSRGRSPSGPPRRSWKGSGFHPPPTCPDRYELYERTLMSAAPGGSAPRVHVNLRRAAPPGGMVTRQDPGDLVQADGRRNERPRIDGAGGVEVDGAG